MLLQKSSCFQFLLLRHLTSHNICTVATHLRCGGIFSDIVLLQIFPDSGSEIICENRLIFDKVKA